VEEELEALRAENARLRSLLGMDRAEDNPSGPWRPTLFSEVQSTASRRPVDHSASREEKVALFRSLFVGRADVYAARWANERTGKAGWSPQVEGGWANARRPDKRYLPLTEDVVRGHLAGSSHIGLYPLMDGDTCRLLACDFDGTGWLLDALAYYDSARAAGIPAALERSRSGDGGHVWVFFGQAVPASSARRIGVHLLREAMTVRAEMDLASYDRLFPAQDFVPKGSFGNLIAVPLQGECRKRGNTVFLNRSTLEPFPDQWAHLSSIEPVSRETVAAVSDAMGDLTAGPDTSFRRPKHQRTPAPPKSVAARAGAMLTIDRIGLPPDLVSALKHLASLHNPEFYEKERLRLSTWNTPRFIRCYRESLGQLLLPRGLRDKAEQIIADAGSSLVIADAGEAPQRIDVSLRSELAAEQLVAAEALARHHLGLLVAPPGSGKTVIGCSLIARHQVPTLVIVDRKPLVEQWRDRLTTHLDLTSRQVGQIGGGRNKQTGTVDIAMAQSLARRDDLASLTTGYGMVIVDECHHVPAVTFERAVRQIPARRWVGLTATPYRRDGLQALMAMHCGPVRHTMTAPPGPALRAMDLITHHTDHLPASSDQHIQAVFRGIVEDKRRTQTIAADIVSASRRGRNCLVLTRWTEHLELITASLRAHRSEPLVLHGQMGKKARRAVIDALAQPGGEDGLILAATASLLGEGFDCPQLDTLFLAFPIRFKGSVVQYVGRVLRPTPEKIRIEVHDYIDVGVPVLARMHDERRTAYAQLGFDLPRQAPVRPAGSAR
jgi:superfamily II DNA or RNA helicase